MSEHVPEIFARASTIAAAARQVLKPPPRLKLSEWADAKFRLSADAGAAEPGRWKTLPFQRGWMDALTDPRIWQVSVMKSARVGWTESLKALIGYHVDHDPCPILLIQPTEDDAKGFSKENIEPLLRDVPDVGEKFARYALRNTLLLRRYRGGLLQLASARKSGDFRRVGRRVVAGDEVDGYPLSTGKEGDPIKLASKRAEYFWNRKLLWGSTPTDAGISRIEQLFQDGDQRRFYVPCPHCGGMQVLQLKQFQWPDKQPELAVYHCIECAAAIDHAHKRDMVAAGEWRPGPHAQFPDVPAPPLFHGHASFHIWAAYSFSPNATWGQICTEFVQSNKAGSEQLKTFVNTGLGETWSARGEAPDWERLYLRRESYAIGTCPDGVLFLTAGVDVQPDRLIFEVVGWGREKRSWSIDAGVFPGNTSDLNWNKGPWADLHALLHRSFPHARGGELAIRMLAIDSGNQTQTVYNWARKYPMSRVIAVKGHDAATALISTPSRVDVTVSGRKLKRGYRVWIVSSTMGKSELYGWLALPTPTDEQLAAGEPFPAGYCHYPEYGDWYFKGLTGEQLVLHRTPRGFTVYVWELIPGRENHPLDARVYARAAAMLVGLDRFRPSDWAALERAIGVQAPAPSTSEPPPASGGPPPMTAPAPRQAPPKKESWLGRRRPGGWLRRKR